MVHYVRVHVHFIVRDLCLNKAVTKSKINPFKYLCLYRIDTQLMPQQIFHHTYVLTMYREHGIWIEHNGRLKFLSLRFSTLEDSQKKRICLFS